MSRKLRIASVTVIAIAIAAAPALCQPTKSGRPERPKYELTIRTKQHEFKAGDVIAVEITIKNTSEEPAFAAPALTTAEAKYQIDVRDERGESALETAYERSLRPAKDRLGREIESVTVVKDGPLRLLQPGETMKEVIVLNRLYDLSMAGTYTAQVQVRGDDKDRPRSNQITITIKPKSPE